MQIIPPSRKALKSIMNQSQVKRDAVSIARAKEHVQSAVSFAEESAALCGLREEEALSLTLATEEIFLYLCRNASADQRVELVRTFGAYYLQMDFVFSETQINLQAFNLTFQPAYDEEQDMEAIGLLLASRQVDAFRLTAGSRTTCSAWSSSRRSAIPSRMMRRSETRRRRIRRCPGPPRPKRPNASPAWPWPRSRVISCPPSSNSPANWPNMVVSEDYACAVAADATA